MNTSIKRLTAPIAPTRREKQGPTGYEHYNAFDLLPVRNLSKAEPGQIVDVNVATYIDPVAQKGFKPKADLPRWQQGLRLYIYDLHKPYLGYTSEIERQIYQEDRYFEGDIINHGAEIPVRGIAHPALKGWLEILPGGVEDDVQLHTVADLKAYIGQISSGEALFQDVLLKVCGSFELGVDRKYV
jgi:hypothetical protein